MGSKRIGLLTGGGDCPGLNAVIRAVVFRAASKGTEVVGLRHGWRGLLNRETQPLDRDAVRDILPRGGTILGTSRTNPRKEKDGLTRCRASFHDLGLSILITVGGEDTLWVAASLHQQARVLAYLIPVDSHDPQATYDLLRAEAHAYSPELGKKQHMVVLTKTDLLPDEKVLPSLDVPQAVDVVSISSVANKGLMEMKECFWRLVAGASESPTKEMLPLP